jgi:hypothetical protein
VLILRQENAPRLSLRAERVFCKSDNTDLHPSFLRADPVDADSAVATTEPPAKKRSKTKPWRDGHGWQSVMVGDELLLGADEGGFAGLEVLEGVYVDDHYNLHSKEFCS